ncbi:hypothetical protein CDCA_CDCA02G0665 [Cyanidium caldarium]|uniref:RING-type domain-containing protein n=1 Tax=Cyanidium caldarium TaxID=2771 RepID=A0AAV9IRC9_CYACA|nr:hypothetical protein CDCA_CDCA02G0665 [Cyanidium caldarium]
METLGSDDAEVVSEVTVLGGANAVEVIDVDEADNEVQFVSETLRQTARSTAAHSTRGGRLFASGLTPYPAAPPSDRSRPLTLPPRGDASGVLSSSRGRPRRGRAAAAAAAAVAPTQRSVHQRIIRRLREIASGRRETRERRTRTQRSPGGVWETARNLLSDWLGWHGTDREWLEPSVYHDILQWLEDSPTAAATTTAAARWRRQPAARATRATAGRTSPSRWELFALNDVLAAAFSRNEGPGPCPHEMLQLLPVHRATPRDLHETCAVCLCEYQRGDRLRRLPCMHAFHVDCIDPWLLSDCRCPIDKYSVVSGLEDAESQRKLRALCEDDAPMAQAEECRGDAEEVPAGPSVPAPSTSARASATRRRRSRTGAASQRAVRAHAAATARRKPRRAPAAR